MVVRSRLALSLLVAVAACGGDDAPNLPPTATQDFVTVDEDMPIAIDVLANDKDPEGEPLRLVKAVADGHETKVEGGMVHVTPDANWNGSIDVIYTVTDGEKHAIGHALVTVTPVNDAPTARTATVSTGRNQVKVFHLEGTDIDGDALTFEVEGGPAHGELSGAAPDITYKPATGYVGDDEFTFHARDAASSSSPAKITIHVLPGAAPVPDSQTVSTDEDTSKAITLTATDADADAITYAIKQQPLHGTLTGTPPMLTYVPTADFNGFDTFTFEATDGTLTSNPAFVNINVAPRNDAPVALPKATNATEDQAVTFSLSGTDVDGDPLTYTIVTPPTRGSLSGGGSALRSYYPSPNLNGADTFTFTVSDGTTTSAPATVTINVAPVQDPPTATAQSLSASEDTARAIVLAGTDVDGDTLGYTVTTTPAHGTLTGTPPMVTYTPAANFNGADSFSFSVNDGQATSAPVAVSLTVAAVDDPPTLAGAMLSGNEGINIALSLPATDIDGETLTYTVATPPAKGAVLGSGSALTYNSGNGNGIVTFALTASDGHSSTAPATFTVSVAPVADAPIARDDVGIVKPNQSLRVSILANDEEVDGDTMSVQSIGTPLHGTAVLDGDDIVYTTTPDNLATDKVTYTVVDSTGLTSTATVYLGINEFPTGIPTRFVENVVEMGSIYDQVLQQDISRDGRYVAFTTKSALTPGDTNDASDVYLFDRLTSTRERISVPMGGGVANGGSDRPSISADGRYIAFASAATNLVPNDTNGTVDVFVRDRVAGTTKRVSVTSSGAQVSGISRDPDISADGSVIAFVSSAFELVPNDANGAADIFVRDMATETTTRVSVRGDGGEADLASVSPSLSDDGNVVAFVSQATNFVPNDTNAKADVFVHVRSTHTTERVSVSSTGIEANGASGNRPALSSDGRFVAFASAATNLAPGTTSSGATFVRDRQALTTVLGAGYSSSVWLSGDGRYLVAHYSTASTVLRDRFAAQSVTLATYTVYPVISANGRYIAVVSTIALDNEPRVGAKLYIMPNPL